VKPVTDDIEISALLYPADLPPHGFLNFIPCLFRCLVVLFHGSVVLTKKGGHDMQSLGRLQCISSRLYVCGGKKRKQSRVTRS
jgi:hypothetical protein